MGDIVKEELLAIESIFPVKEKKKIVCVKRKKKVT